MRIERIEKEQEKYRIYQDVDPEIIDQAQKRLGAKAQITRTLEKYRRALEELNHRIQELNNLYRTLEVSGADEETLSQFDLMFERHKNLEQLRDELYQLQIKKTNVAFHRSKLSQMDGQKLEEDMQEYRRLEQMKQEKQPEKSNTAGIFVLVFGLVFVLAGVAAALFGGEMVPAAAAYGAILIGIVASATGLILLLTLRKASGKGRKGESLERICQMQQDILEDYQLSHEVDPLACLEEMLGKVQVNNYKIKQFEEQENLLLEEILSKNQRVNQLDAEISAYLGRLTAKAAPLNEEGNIQESSETESVLEEQENGLGRGFPARKECTVCRRSPLKITAGIGQSGKTNPHRFTAPAFTAAANHAGGRKLQKSDRADQYLHPTGSGFLSCSRSAVCGRFGKMSSGQTPFG